VAAYKIIEKELAEHSSGLLEKPRIVVATKMDAADPARLRKLQQWCRQREMELIKISSVTGEGLEELKHGIVRKLSSAVPAES
jgi:GTP-binding protein